MLIGWLLNSLNAILNLNTRSMVSLCLVKILVFNVSYINCLLNMEYYDPFIRQIRTTHF
jgi:hypothetical protein